MCAHLPGRHGATASAGAVSPLESRSMKTSQHKHGLSVQFFFSGACTSASFVQPYARTRTSHTSVLSKRSERGGAGPRAAGPGARPQCARCRALAPEQGGRAPEPSRNRGRLSFLCLSRPPPPAHTTLHTFPMMEKITRLPYLASLKIALCGSFSTQRWRFRRPSRTWIALWLCTSGLRMVKVSEHRLLTVDLV